MTSLTIVSARTSKQVCLLGTAILFLAGFCFSQPAISVSPTDGPPTTSLRVSGSGFAPNAKIDIYFGTQDEAVAMTNGAGSFSQIAIPAPASTLPGAHWVSAVERSGRTGAQATFMVSTSWKQFHRHNMVRWNQYENVLNVNNVGSLQLKWSYATGGSVFSSPAVSNGVVYVGSDDNNVYALKASTGAKLWSYATGNYVFSAPAVSNGVVYVGSDDGNVYALNASTGALLWSYPTGDQVLSSPAIVNGVVYVSSLDNNVYALKASTGAKLWSYATGDHVESSPAVRSGVVYVGSGDGNVYALNASTGALLWSYPIGFVASSPAVANGVVYVGSFDDRKVYALKASTGTLLWSYPTAGPVYSSPAVANGVVYVVSDNTYALSASTGALLWSYPTKGEQTSPSPAVANGVVYVGSNDGNVYAFGLKQGSEQADSKRPGLKTLRPDFNLKVSQPVATRSGPEF